MEKYTLMNTTYRIDFLGLIVLLRYILEIQEQIRFIS